MAVDDTDKDLANFIASTDYTTYLERFGRTPLAGRKRLLTYNNTTVQALWLPTINNADEKEVLFTFYRLGTTKYLSWVANTRGELSNLLDMNGEWKLLTVNNDVAITGLYTESKWNSLSFSPDINPSDLPFLTCMNHPQVTMARPPGTPGSPSDLHPCRSAPVACLHALPGSAARHNPAPPR